MSSKQLPRWETYLKQMSRLTLGEALCEPAPLPYFERIQLGDVGYILGGCFHLLFSAGCPLDGRELGAEVPRTFKQLIVGPTFNTQPRSPGCLSTNTVREIPGRGRGPMYPMLEPGSSTSLQLTGNQGAALLTKHPTYREDVQLGRVFEEYTKEHYDSWVAFARERGHPSDIKLILVTGVDMTRDFAMISYSNNGDDMTAEFTLSPPGLASPWGNWRAPGVIYTNCGPQPCRPPSGDSHTEIVSDEYNQCVFVRYYTMRKRLGIPRVLKAAAGPHDLGSRGRDGEESLLEVEHNSDSGSDMSSVFDDDWDDDRSSVTSIDSEPDIVVHNPTLDERNDFDTIADYVFQNSDADSVLIHHRDIALLRELGGSADLYTQLNEKRPPIAVDMNGVGTIGCKMDPPANTWLGGPLGITTPTPSFISGEIGREATNRVGSPEPHLPSRQGHPPQYFPSRAQEATPDVGGSIHKSVRSTFPAWAHRAVMTRSRAIKSLAFVVLSVTYTQCWMNSKANDIVVFEVDYGKGLTDPKDAVGLTYEACTSWCGSQQESFDWSTFSQQFSAWLLPWLALINQLPFGTESSLDNLISIVLAVGSPTLAAFSLALTALNARWAYNRFSATNHPNHRKIAKALVYLQHVPLHITTRDGLSAPLIVFTENGDWWECFASRLQQTHTWTISGATSIVWVVVAFIIITVDSFMNPGEDANPTGLGVGSVWLWIIPIVVGWLWIPVCSYDHLKAAIEKANDLAFVTARNSLPRTNGLPDTSTPTRAYGISRHQAIGLHKAAEIFTEDTVRTAPVFNYSRFLMWSSNAEAIAQLFDDNRIGTIGQVQAHISRGQTHCGFPVQGYKEPTKLTPSGMWKRMFVASIFALGLQWGTTGSAVISIFSTPATGPGCRSMPFILYSIVSTMAWVTFLLSSYLAHHTRIRYEGGVVPHPGFNFTSVAKGLTTFLRWLSIFAAGCNGLGIVISCMSQFTNFHTTCYCNSRVLGWVTEVAYSIAATDKLGSGQMKGGWIGGIVITFMFLFFLHFTLDRSHTASHR